MPQNSSIIVSSSFRYYAKESFADIHKVNGLKGIYIASVLQNSSDLNPSKQVCEVRPL